MTNPNEVTTVILAGGKGSRMGGDKALQELHGRPLIDWVIGCMRPQGTRILISANGNAAKLARFGFPILPDLHAGQAGPLAGVHAAMHAVDSEWVVSVPCDTPFLPDDLLLRLMRAVGEAEAAVAVTGGKWQPTIALYRRHLLGRLDSYLATGGRKVGDWLRLLDVREAVFEEESAFINFNTLAELDAANGMDES